MIFAGIIALVFGIRVASIMSRALSRVNDALKKLEQQEYVHVDMVKTGDELEDSATGFNKWSTACKSETSCETRSAST